MIPGPDTDVTSSPISGPISRGYIIICVSVWWAEFDWKHDYPQQNKNTKLEFLHLFLTATTTVCDHRSIDVHMYSLIVQSCTNDLLFNIRNRRFGQNTRIFKKMLKYFDSFTYMQQRTCFRTKNWHIVRGCYHRSITDKPPCTQFMQSLGVNTVFRCSIL